MQTFSVMHGTVSRRDKKQLSRDVRRAARSIAGERLPVTAIPMEVDAQMAGVASRDSASGQVTCRDKRPERVAVHYGEHAKQKSGIALYNTTGKTLSRQATVVSHEDPSGHNVKREMHEIQGRALSLHTHWFPVCVTYAP